MLANDEQLLEHVRLLVVPQQPLFAVKPSFTTSLLSIAQFILPM